MGPRPSMRMPSSTMRLRTIFFCSDRTAALISLSRPSNSAPSVVHDGGDGGVGGQRCARPCRRWRWPRRCGRCRPRPPGRRPRRRSRPGSRKAIGGFGAELGSTSSFWSVDRLLDPGSWPPRGPAAMTSSVDLGGAVLVVAPGVLGAAGLDHHDGDVAVVERTAGHDQLEGGLVALLVGGVGDPLAVGGEGHAHGADGAVEGDAGEHQGGGGAVDGQHVVGVLLVGAEDGAHDVDLVAEALGERRAQRAGRSGGR